VQSGHSCPLPWTLKQFFSTRNKVLDKLADQAAGISQNREFVVASLKAAVPKFCQLVDSN